MEVLGRRRSRRSPWIGLGLVVLLFAALAGCNDSTPVVGPNPPPPPPPPPPPVYCPCCGVELPHDTELGHRATLVMIDNHSGARPQTGIDQACLVFEMLAEGGITRLAPVYVHGTPELIGPVRSARHYFLDLAVGLDALYAHVGQSPQAAVDIKALRVADLNEFFHDAAYWRQPGKASPHNVYTSIIRLHEAASKAKLSVVRSGEVRWPFALAGRTDEAKGSACTGVEVIWPYSSGKNVTGFDYRPATGLEPGRYERRVNGKPHIDEGTGEVMRAANVVIVYAKFTRVPGDTEGRLEAELTGSGKATVLRQGVSYEVTWRKSSRTSPLVLVDRDGRPVELDTGQTWIQIVPTGAEVKLLRPQ